MKSRDDAQVICLPVLWMILFVFTSGGALANVQSFRVVPESVMVSEAEDVELKCAVNNQQGKAQWTKDGFALGFERDVPGYPRYKYSGNARTGEHNLIIKGITLQDDGEYQCQVGPTGATLPIWAAANVTVIVPPSDISIVGWKDGLPVEVMAGASFILQCIVADARPKATIQWFKNGVLMDAENQVDEEFPGRRNRLLSIRSRIVIHPTAEDDGKHFSCRGNHIALENPAGYLTTTVSLSVLHLPGAPIFKGYKESQVLQSGQNQDLSCLVNGGNPRPSVIWYKNDVLVDDSMIYEEKRVINTYRLRVTENEDKAVLECRVTSDMLEAPTVANITLDVHYPASFVKIDAPSFVRREEYITMECESGGSNPPSSVSWNIDGREVEASMTNVSERKTGGWKTKSIIENLQLIAHKEESNKLNVNVECLAFNPEFSKAASQSHKILIVNPPEKPVLEGLDGTLIAGKETVITCSSFGGNPPPTMTLFKQGKKLSSRTSQQGRLTETVSELRVQDKDNNLQVTCQVDHPSSGSYLSSSRTLHVLFSSSKIQGKAIPPTVEEGDEVSLICESSTSNPPSNVTWSVQDSELDGSSQYFVESDYGGKITHSQLKLRTTAEDDRKVFTCTTFNGLEESATNNVSVAVNHAPIWIVKPPNYIDVREGDNLKITFSVSARPRPTKYEWKKEGLSLSTNLPFLVQESGLFIERVFRQVAGNYSLGIRNSKGHTETSFVIDVLYGPADLHAPTKVTVNEDSLAVMECSATGNPKPLITWTKLNRSEPLASGKGSARLFIDQTSRHHTGVYVCTASNEVATVSAEPSKLLIKHAPIIMSQQIPSSLFYATLGSHGKLNCLAKAAPRPTFLWHNPREKVIQNGTKYLMLGPKLLDGLSLWQSTLKVRDVQPSDYSKYKCEIHNMFGLDKGFIELAPPLIPKPPKNLRIVNVTASGTVVFTWMQRNLDQQSESQPLITSYILRYWEDGDRLYEEKEIPSSKYTTASISFMSPGRVYIITLAAKNADGVSGFAHPPLTVHIPGVMGEASSSSRSHGQNNGGLRAVGSGNGSPFGWRVPRLLLLITTLTGAALLALNIAIIACFVRRRKRERNISVSSSKTTSLGVYYAPQVSPSAENVDASRMAQNSPVTASQSQMTPPCQEKTAQTNNAQHLQSSTLLLQVDDDSSRRRCNPTLSPCKNIKPSQQYYKSCIPLDLLEGSNIPMHDSPTSAITSPGISSFTSNNANNFGSIVEPSVTSIGVSNANYSNLDLTKHSENDDRVSLSSVSSNNRIRSPKSRPSGKEEFRIQSFPVKDHLNGDAKISTLRRKGSKRENNFPPNYSNNAEVTFNKQDSSCDQTEKFLDNRMDFKTLGNRGRNKKDQPKFATLQKMKTGKGLPTKLEPDDVAYATINIKTSPKHRQPNLKLRNNDSCVISAIPIKSSSPTVNYEEAPRYINLRTFRENHSIPQTTAVASNGEVENSKRLIMDGSSSNHIANEIPNVFHNEQSIKSINETSLSEFNENFQGDAAPNFSNNSHLLYSNGGADNNSSHRSCETNTKNSENIKDITTNS